VGQKGTLFWSSPKRPPTPIIFDWNDPTHRNFIISVSSLWAEVWGLERFPSDLNRIENVLKQTKIPPFVPKSSKKIETDESLSKDQANAKEKEAPVDDLEVLLKELISHFESNPPNKIKRLKPLDFEKDDDKNFHIDYIASVSNLRARMYSIKESERLQIKAIAGRIMPAIATTTAAVSGLVSIELIKLFKREKPKLEDFKNLFMNLALPLWSMSEPGNCEKKKNWRKN